MSASQPSNAPASNGPPLAPPPPSQPSQGGGKRADDTAGVDTQKLRDELAQLKADNAQLTTENNKLKADKAVMQTNIANLTATNANLTANLMAVTADRQRLYDGWQKMIHSYTGVPNPDPFQMRFHSHHSRKYGTSEAFYFADPAGGYHIFPGATLSGQATVHLNGTETALRQQLATTPAGAVPIAHYTPLHNAISGVRGGYSKLVPKPLM
eukprot:TRINITY_DN94158_c0_g1_i1.p1 TRINITY_DN94158_c0_g1~~TRINITY_DN94158_c0_g1_i1.p1  ORF type:complete len:211 (+),score=5.87 TRINITY_DN94158_c0_g1_i1:21-653(+)